MIDTIEKPKSRRATRGARRFGYVVAIAVNIVGIVVVNNLLEWEWPSFLTDDFSSIEGLIVFSFAANIAANVVWLFADPRWMKALGQCALNVITVVVSVRVLQVFPFDFSAWTTNWSWVLRTMLIIAIVGGAIGAVAELVKLSRAGREGARTPD